MTAAEAPVERVAAAVYRIPTDAPEADGTIAWDSTTMVTVTVTAGGQTGLGASYTAPAAQHLVEQTLAPVVTGRCALDVTAAYQAMHRAVRNIGRPGVAATAISAVDIALWDLKARLLDLPLARLLGVVRTAVPVYGSGGFTTYDDRQLTAQFGGWVHEQGIPRVKMKIGESWGGHVERDLARIRLARQVIGPHAALYVDANGAYQRKQAIRVAQAAAGHDITWFEEPVSSDDLDGLRQVRDAVLPDVAAGEYGYDLPYFARMIGAGAVDCVQADLTRCGGITEWRNVAAVAAAHGLQVSGHCAPHLHRDVAAATPNLRHLEWFHDHVRIESMLLDGAAAPDPGGTLAPNLSAPGHGLTLDQDRAQQYRIG
ncbi:enolase C-terminal domain-like protein [Dactylosporangium sp. CA-152071]|uniref:enolase C-terminal domain-like protein n=1 Tax=Dactylosporangium sp. CA-152071 TaxID=3239933 RepID=UPI003D8CBAE1